MLWEVLVRIPIVTAGFEELAFRGVLLAALLGSIGTRGAVAVQSVLFGLGHILPTAGPDTAATEVLLAVVFTAAAGVVLAWLRLRSGSLIAPWILHATTNGVTFAAAWIVTDQAG